jgi:hypothetical protein
VDGRRVGEDEVVEVGVLVGDATPSKQTTRERSSASTAATRPMSPLKTSRA